MVHVNQPKSLFLRLFYACCLMVFVGACQQITGVPPKGATSKKAVTKDTIFQKTAGTKPKSSYAQFPDIPFPAGARINSEKTTVVGSRPWYGLLSITSMSNPGLMFEFFDSKMESYRWQKIASVRAETSILTFMKDGRVLTISISERALGGSSVSITSSPISKAKNIRQNDLEKNDLMPVPVQKIK